jgi:hypothetical protein
MRELRASPLPLERKLVGFGNDIRRAHAATRFTGLVGGRVGLHSVAPTPSSTAAANISASARQIDFVFGLESIRGLVRIYPTLAINIILFAAVTVTIARYVPAILYQSPPLPTEVITNFLLTNFPING